MKQQNRIYLTGCIAKIIFSSVILQADKSNFSFFINPDNETYKSVA